MWLGYWGRLKVYAALAELAVRAADVTKPGGNTGGWLASLLLIGVR